MNWRAIGTVFLALLVAGLVTRPLEGPAWRIMKENEPALELANLEGILGQGVTVGLLGGFRAMVANFLWLRANKTWENYDRPATTALINLVTAVDPRPTYFWLNGARMIAYDMSVWRVREAGGFDDLPLTVIARLDAEQGQIAIDYLRRGWAFHPENALFPIEIGNIYQRKLHDKEQAAEHFRIASLMPNHPPYAPRIHAELLRRLGRDREAYEWLVDLFPRLDLQDGRNRADVVLFRIRELEDTLGVPPEERFQTDVQFEPPPVFFGPPVPDEEQAF